MHYTLVHMISSHAVHVAVYHCKQISGLIDLPREVKTHTVGQHGWQTCLKQGWLTYTHVDMECASSRTPSSERNTQYNVAHIPYWHESMWTSIVLFSHSTMRNTPTLDLQSYLCGKWRMGRKPGGQGSLSVAGNRWLSHTISWKDSSHS